MSIAKKMCLAGLRYELEGLRLDSSGSEAVLLSILSVSSEL